MLRARLGKNSESAGFYARGPDKPVLLGAAISTAPKARDCALLCGERLLFAQRVRKRRGKSREKCQKHCEWTPVFDKGRFCIL
jgi:hypothetical protein